MQENGHMQRGTEVCGSCIFSVGRRRRTACRIAHQHQCGGPDCRVRFTCLLTSAIFTCATYRIAMSPNCPNYPGMSEKADIYYTIDL